MEAGVFYKEVRLTKVRGSWPRLVDMREIVNHTGFSSVYAYDGDTTRSIKETGSTAGLRGRSIYSDTLYVDIDNNDAGEFSYYLKDNNITHTLYLSGKKGYHFHIKQEPVEGAWIPASQKAWAKEHCDNADLSIYHPCAIIRLPGTYHEDNPGSSKRIVEEFMGESLCLPKLTETSPVTYKSTSSEGDNHLFSAILLSKGEGGRRPYLFVLACLCIERAMSYADTIFHLLWWNSNVNRVPHEPDVVVRFVDDVWRRRVAVA
jgi:hypothetical protein